MNNRYHRKENANEYKQDSADIITRQIEELSSYSINSNPIDLLSNPDYISPISLDELQLAIDLSKSKSSPGPDGIDYRVLKLLPKEYIKCLLHLFNEILISGCFPKEW